MTNSQFAGKIIISSGFWESDDKITDKLEKADVSRMFFQEVNKSKPANLEITRCSNESDFLSHFPDSIEIFWQGKKYLAGYYEPGEKFGFVEIKWNKAG